MLFAKSSPTKVLKSFFPFFGTPIVNGPIYLVSNYEPPPIFFIYMFGIERPIAKTLLLLENLILIMFRSSKPYFGLGS